MHGFLFFFLNKSSNWDPCCLCQKWRSERGNVIIPSWRLEQNPAVMLTSQKKIQKRLKEFASCIWCKRKSGGSQWDHPLCAWFLVVDLALTSSHTKKSHICSPNSVSVEVGMKDCSCCIPLKGAALTLGVSKAFAFWGCLQNIPTPTHLLCISAGGQQFLYNTHQHCILLIVFHLVLTPLEGKEAFFALPKPTKICWWMFPPRPKSLFCRSFPKPQQEPLHHLLILRTPAWLVPLNRFLWKK